MMLLETALKAMRQGATLMLGHVPGHPDKREYYLIAARPLRSGKVDQDSAKIIIARPDVNPSEDGLFPGNSQTWKLKGNRDYREEKQCKSS